MSSTHLDLKPRAVAVLVALRKGPRAPAALADALAEDSIAELRALLVCMVAEQLIRAYSARVWGLTHDGLGWLQSNGLDATQDAKEALYAMTDAELETKQLHQ